MAAGAAHGQVIPPPRTIVATLADHARGANHRKQIMKKIMLSLLIASVLMPSAAFADHLNGTWGGWGSNYISFSVGNNSHRFRHGGRVPFVDDHGAAVDYHTLRRGHPITVDYSGGHGHERVNRVIVHQRSSRHRGH